MVSFTCQATVTTPEEGTHTPTPPRQSAQPRSSTNLKNNRKRCFPQEVDVSSFLQTDPQTLFDGGGPTPECVCVPNNVSFKQCLNYLRKHPATIHTAECDDIIGRFYFTVTSVSLSN